MNGPTPEELAADAAARLTGAVEVGQWWVYVDGRIYRVDDIVPTGTGLGNGTALEPTACMRTANGRTVYAPVSQFTPNYKYAVWRAVDDPHGRDRGAGILG